ncbi:hypothetical protein [Thiocapsa sp. N5-Cardenillas]|uniref:hypothetical protein n=1 Tax=Thiocapsa sp. N5-Cardenillas TaxID=3137397 RepID=UPI0035AE8FB2
MATKTLTAAQAAFLESADYKKFEANFQKAQEEATRSVKTNGYTFSDGSHLDFKGLVLFVQTTLGVKDGNSPASVWQGVSEARKALGTLMPAQNKWKGLQALLK